MFFNRTYTYFAYKYNFTFSCIECKIKIEKWEYVCSNNYKSSLNHFKNKYKSFCCFKNYSWIHFLFNCPIPVHSCFSKYCIVLSRFFQSNIRKWKQISALSKLFKTKFGETTYHSKHLWNYKLLNILFSTPEQQYSEICMSFCANINISSKFSQVYCDKDTNY